MNNELNLQFFAEPPDLSSSHKLTITALAPLSMVSSQPGMYFRSELSPTSDMLYGLLENALGWHFFDDAKKNNIRTIIMKGLVKQAKKENRKNKTYKEHEWLSAKFKSAKSGFKSLLQYHVKFTEKELPQNTMTYDDLWSMGNRTEGDSFIGGSRNYDARLEFLINRSKQGDPSKPAKRDGKHPAFVSFGDRAEYQTYTLQELINLKEGKAKTTSLKPHFPMYYSSPRKRAYVIPDKPYVYMVKCTHSLAELIANAIDEPRAPLYLGTNDGWVDVKWEAL